MMHRFTIVLFPSDEDIGKGNFLSDNEPLHDRIDHQLNHFPYSGSRRSFSIKPIGLDAIRVHLDESGRAGLIESLRGDGLRVSEFKGSDPEIIFHQAFKEVQAQSGVYADFHDASSQMLKALLAERKIHLWDPEIDTDCLRIKVSFAPERSEQSLHGTVSQRGAYSLGDS